MLLVPRHCGFGVPEVFFSSGSPFEPIVRLNRRLVLWAPGDARTLIFDSAILDFVSTT
jgi:hypothetical protein